jgi:hypothetical protein
MSLLVRVTRSLVLCVVLESPQFQQLAREFCEAVGDPHSYCFIIIICIDLMSEEELFVYIMD